MGLSVSKTVDAARSARIGTDEALYLTHRGLVVLSGGRFPKHALPLMAAGRDVDWDDIAARIAAWAEHHNIELDP